MTQGNGQNGTLKFKRDKIALESTFCRKEVTEYDESRRPEECARLERAREEQASDREEDRKC